MRCVISTLVALAASVNALGSAIVLNNSTSPIYLWSVDSSVGPEQTLAPGGTYSEQFHHDDQTGGIAIKITKSANGLYNGDAEQMFSYSLTGDQVWYDLSSVFGEPFAGQPLEVTSKSGGSIVWPTGSNPGGSQVHVTSSDEDVLFTVNGAPGHGGESEGG